MLQLPADVLEHLISFVSNPSALIQTCTQLYNVWNNAFTQREWWRHRHPDQAPRLFAFWTVNHAQDALGFLDQQLRTPTGFNFDTSQYCLQLMRCVSTCQKPKHKSTALVRVIFQRLLQSNKLDPFANDGRVIQLCAQLGLCDLMQDLLNYTDVDQRQFLPVDLLELAVQHGHHDMLVLLLSQGVPPSWLALTAAAVTTQIPCIRTLLEADNPPPNSPLLRWTLAYLVERDSVSGVELLLDMARSSGRPAPPDILHHCLLVAINLGGGDATRCLLRFGADASEHNWEAWYSCAHRSCVDVTVALLEFAPSPPLSWIAAHVVEWTRILKDIVRGGRADLLQQALYHLNSTVRFGPTRLADILVEAAKVGDVACGMVLLNAGALPFATATVIEPGRALLEAAYNGHLHFVRLLLDHEDRLPAVQILTESALIAADRGHMTIVRFILKLAPTTAQAVLDSIHWFRDSPHKNALRIECLKAASMATLTSLSSFSAITSSKSDSALNVCTSSKSDTLLSPCHSSADLQAC